MYPWYTAGGMFRGKDFAHSDWPPDLYGRFVSHADWSRVIGAVDMSPGEVWIDYIRQAQGDGQSIVAVPRSLVSPTLFSFRDVIFTARSSLYWTICGTDWVLPAGFKVLCWSLPSVGSWMQMVSR